MLNPHTMTKFWCRFIVQILPLCGFHPFNYSNGEREIMNWIGLIVGFFFKKEWFIALTLRKFCGIWKEN